MRVNGEILREPYLRQGTMTEGLRALIVPPGSVYLMGDNRGNARDSRADGPVTAASVTGRVDYVNLPLDWIAIGLTPVSGSLFVYLLARPALLRRRLDRAAQLYPASEMAP